MKTNTTFQKYESIYTSFLEKLLVSLKLCVTTTILSFFKKKKVSTAF